MSEVSTLQPYANFNASCNIVLAHTSATDFSWTDQARSLDEGGTESLETFWTGETFRRLYPSVASMARDVSSGGDLGPLIVVSEQDKPLYRKGMSDFAALDYLRTPEGQIRRQIKSLRRSFELSYRERLARRLEFLLEAMEEEGESWTKDSPESLRRMLLFLDNAPIYRFPTVTVTPSGTFRAQWTASAKRHFALDFLPTGQIHFVVFSPDPRHSNRVQRVSGVTSWECLKEVVEPFKVHHWTADVRT